MDSDVQRVEFLTRRSQRGVENLINHYFGYQIRILRGRFTPVGFLLEKVFRFFDFFVLFDLLIESCAKLGLNLL